MEPFSLLFSPSTMDPLGILEMLDAERRTVADSGAILETTPQVVRVLGNPRSVIAYSRSSAAEIEQVIDLEIERFTRLGRNFEWKVYSHDQPSDLLVRLDRHGFRIGEKEAVMILDLAELPDGLSSPAPIGITVRRVTEERMITDMLAVEAAVWKDSHLDRADLLANLNDPLERDVAFVAYAEATPVGCGRVATSPQSRFAGLWSGSVIEEFRGRGVYRALLAARIAQAKRRASVRFLRVDAAPTSRSILEKYGFSKVAETWPCDWSL
jgi:GNAT superfamily N-acetyltransferase